MATQEQGPVTLSTEDLERIQAFLNDPSTGIQRGRPKRQEESEPEVEAVDSTPEGVDPEDPSAEIDVLILTLTKERIARGLTQDQVAKRMGTTQSAVADLESGRYDPRLSTLRKWSQAVFIELQARSTKPGKGRIRANRR